MPKVPIGSDQIAAWAASRGLRYQPNPDEEWFRGWEPFDTMAPPTLYVNACTWGQPSGQATIVEPIDVMTFDDDAKITSMKAYWSFD